MDHKEKYEQALKTAKMYYEQNKDFGADFLPIIFPELRESKDERIRKELLAVINDLVLPDEQKARFNAYLEKQKEPLPVPNKFSGLKSLMLQYLQSATNRKDDTEIESDTDLFGRKILDYVWKYSDEQKEQKPVPKFNVGDYVIDTNYKGEPLYQIVGIDKECYICEYRGDKEMGDRTVMHFAFDNPYLRLEQKPEERFEEARGKYQVEWSEEDEKIVNNIVSVLGQYIDYKAVSGTGSGYATPRYAKEIDWLNSLRTTNQGWGKEDEEMRKLLIAILEVNHPDGFFKANELGTTDMRGVHTEEIISWLKSLRPSWKPSEEQMKALESAVKLYKDTHFEIHHEKIVSLYEQLKKLM